PRRWAGESRRTPRTGRRTGAPPDPSATSTWCRSAPTTAWCSPAGTAHATAGGSPSTRTSPSSTSRRPAMPDIQIIVHGLPAAQGSKRYVGHRRGADGRERAVLIEQSKRVKPWRRQVADAAALVRPAELMDGPLVADMVFTFARPKSHYRTGRNAGLLKDTAPAAPAVAPDLSKLARSTEDALT